MVIRFAFLFVLLIFWSRLAFAQSPEILSQAKKEGEVILYTTMTVRDFEFFSKAAKEKYPFLNIRHVYLSSGRQVARVMQEFRAGRVQADVLGNSPEPLLYFKQQGVTGPYLPRKAKTCFRARGTPKDTGPASLRTCSLLDLIRE